MCVYIKTNKILKTSSKTSKNQPKIQRKIENFPQICSKINKRGPRVFDAANPQMPPYFQFLLHFGL